MRDIDGYPYNFQIYKGKETGPKRETLGPRIVEDMARIIRREDADKYILYFDNFFTCHQLLDNLAKKNLRAIEPIRTNRMMKCPLNILKKDERASLNYRSDGNVLFAQWKDNSTVSIGTNFNSITPLTLHRKMKFSIKDFFSKCDQIHRKLRILSHLLKKFLMENFIFCAV